MTSPCAGITLGQQAMSASSAQTPRPKEAKMEERTEINRATGVPWRDVAIFAVLAYGIAWLIWIPEMSTAWEAIASGRTPTPYAAGGLTVLGMLAPGIAAVIMRLFVTKEGLQGSLGPVRHRWRFLAIAAVGPALFVLASVGIAAGTRLADFSLGTDEGLPYVLVMLLAIGTPVSAVLAFGEEYGWRGYLLPKLLALGEIKASIVIALIWAPWHLPILFAGLNYGGENPAAVLAFMVALGIMLSLFFTRMFVAAGGSVLVVAVMHGSLNAFGDRLSNGEHLLGDPFVASIGGLVGFALMAAVLVAAYGLRSRSARGTRGRSATSDSGPGVPAAPPRAIAGPVPRTAGSVRYAAKTNTEYEASRLHEYNRGQFPPR
jgi:uncharacterized protein